MLAQVDGLTDVTTSTEEAPDQLLLEQRDMAFAYGLNSQSTLRNVSWALRGAQLARFQEQAARFRCSSSTTARPTRASTP